MRPVVTVDIETIPLIASLSTPYPEGERTPPANYKLPETITKWRAEDERRWSEARAKECSLNPRLGRVLCIGTSVNDDKPTVVTAAHEGEERDVLSGFWQKLAAFPTAPLLVTWNGQWDLRFLLIRSLAHGVSLERQEALLSQCFKRYSTAHHYDCKAVLLNYPSNPPTGEGLDEWAKFLGTSVSGKSGHGADVYPMFLRGELDQIAEYCSTDVELTSGIYSRISGYFV
jgi:predicted PolB exonuclease-like 3'-5' exonuclease